MNNHYIGTVVSNKDPQKLGRCRVKIHGLYDSLNDNDLPWIQMMIPLNHHVIYPPDIGRQVICMSMDSHNQTILIIGIVPGVNDTTTGEDSPDTPSLARNDADDPPAIINTIASQRVTSTTTLGGLYNEALHVVKFTQDVMDGKWSDALNIIGGDVVISDAINNFSNDTLSSLKDQMGDVFPVGATEYDKDNLIKGISVNISGVWIDPTPYQQGASDAFKSAIDVPLEDVTNGIVPSGVNFNLAKDISGLVQDPASTLSSPLTAQTLSYFQTPAGAISAVTGEVTLTENAFGYNAKYPYCKVEETNAGWTITDSTPGSSMIVTIANDGSYTKILNGTVIQKAVGKTQHIHSDLDIITTGSNSEKSLTKTVVVDGVHDENSTIRNINAAAGMCNLWCPLTGSPNHIFGGTGSSLF